MVIFFADVKFAADDRLDARFLRRIHEMHRAKNVAVVGHGHGRHAQFLDPLAQLFYVAGAVEQRVIGMQMQMDELRHEWRIVLRNAHCYSVNRSASGAFSRFSCWTSLALPFSVWPQVLLRFGFYAFGFTAAGCADFLSSAFTGAFPGFTAGIDCGFAAVFAPGNCGAGAAA